MCERTKKSKPKTVFRNLEPTILGNSIGKQQQQASTYKMGATKEKEKNHLVEENHSSLATERHKYIYIYV